MKQESAMRKSQSDLYAWLPQEVRDQLAAVEEHKSVPAGTRLIDHNVVPSHLVVLNSGNVEISLQAQGQSVPLAVAGPGSAFDLRALVCGVMPCVDVVCRSACQVALVPREEFTRVLGSHPQAYFAVAKVLSSDLKAANDALRRLLSKPPRAFRRVKPCRLESPTIQPL
jgi:CRP-like cAMP-binding protein